MNLKSSKSSTHSQSQRFSACKKPNFKTSNTLKAVIGHLIGKTPRIVSIWAKVKQYFHCLPGSFENKSLHMQLQSQSSRNIFLTLQQKCVILQFVKAFKSSIVSLQKLINQTVESRTRLLMAAWIEIDRQYSSGKNKSNKLSLFSVCM